MANGPNPVRVAFSVYRARRVRLPEPLGHDTADHETLARALDAIAAEGLARLPSERPRIDDYRTSLEAIDPDRLQPAEALAYWLNLYNAGALALAAAARDDDRASVLRVPGAFTGTWARVAGEDLSLTDIEHGKIRRFKDPRIHGALVCGTASCPTLRFEPYYGPKLDTQLDEQMRHFLNAGGATPDKSENRLMLSRIFLWYGGDYTRPERMPTWLPPSKRGLAGALIRWLEPDVAAWVLERKPSIGFQAYDWELACSVS